MDLIETVFGFKYTAKSKIAPLAHKCFVPRDDNLSNAVAIRYGPAPKTSRHCEHLDLSYSAIFHCSLNRSPRPRRFNRISQFLVAVVVAALLNQIPCYG
jgi:hypothetical protein